MLEKRQLAWQVGARPAEVGQRFFCERALAATRFMRADVRPSLRSLDAFDIPTGEYLTIVDTLSTAGAEGDR